MTMACKGANMVLLVLLLLPASLAQAQGRATDSGWNLGRVTYYGELNACCCWLTQALAE